MHLIDVDPEMMRQHFQAVAHAYEQSIVHVEAEIKGVIPELMETLTPEGPFGYTIMPEVHPDGGVRLPILRTRKEIEGAYKMIRGASNLLTVTPLTEIRGTWYTFQDNISRGELKSTGDRGAHRTLALFPSGTGTGITGELVWIQVPPSALGGGATPEPAAEEMFRRENVYLQHERYLEALRVGDLEGVLATLHDRVASAVRDYVENTGTLTTLEGREAHRAYYEAFFRALRRRRGGGSRPGGRGLVRLRRASDQGQRPGGRRGRQVDGLPHRRVPHAGERRPLHCTHRARHRPDLGAHVSRRSPS